MFGAVAKNYLAPKLGVKREDLVVVSIMPCLAKKSERAREELAVNGDSDVNYTLSTRELAHMIRQCNLNLNDMPEEDFDSPLGQSTGAAVIFGATGGVMEAALRTAYELHTGKTLPKVEFHETRGFDGVKEATIDIDGFPLKIAVVYSLANARKMMEQVRQGVPVSPITTATAKLSASAWRPSTARTRASPSARATRIPKFSPSTRSTTVNLAAISATSNCTPTTSTSPINWRQQSKLYNM